MDTIDQYLNVMRHIRNTDRQIREESYIISQSRASIQTLVTAKKVISTLDAHSTFLRLGDRSKLPGDFARAIDDIDYDMGYMQIHLTLKGLPTFEKQLEFGYKKVMGRALNDKKLELLKELYHDALGHYEEDIKIIDFPASASKRSGKERYDLAAMTVVANTLLNLDEFVVKG